MSVSGAADYAREQTHGWRRGLPSFAAPRLNADRRRRRTRRRAARGITLIEVLATIVLMAIVLPVAMQGVSTAVAASQGARQRSEAVSLAEARLAHLVATGEWQYGLLSGDFGPEWPDYRWSGQAVPWQNSATLKQLSVSVTWTARGQERQVMVATLVYGGQESAL